MNDFHTKVKRIELPTDWPVGPVNVYLIFGEKLTLIDAGRKLGKSWTEFKGALRKEGLLVRDIEQVILTHHHGDHIGLLDYILEDHPVPVYAHGNCRPFLLQDRTFFKNSREFFENFYKEFGLPEEKACRLAAFKDRDESRRRIIHIERELQDGDIITGLKGWQVVETKGHAQSHISLYNSEERILMCGDHLIGHLPAGVFLEAPHDTGEERSKPLIQYIESLRKLLKLSVDITLSGHGEPIEHLSRKIHETLIKIDKRSARVKGKLLRNKKNGYELVHELYGQKAERAMGVFVSDAIGLLDLLQHRNEITAENHDGILYYIAN
jgi:glyoxylase-like metal-dependent hydrolase (beta-lactamase superfamily II)